MRGRSIQSCVVCLLSAAVVVGCGGEPRSGAVPASDTAAVTAPDTVATRPSDTAAAARPDTVTRQDTATVTRAPAPAARTAPATPPRKPAPRPRPVTPQTRAPAAVERPETTAAAPQAADTAPPQTADTATVATAPTNQANSPLRDQYHQAPRDTVAPAVYDGWKQYNLNCARCHGEDVQGTTIAPHLLVSLRPDGPIKTKELFVQTVCAGRPAKGMPAWCPLGMEMPTIDAIYQYVKGRSEGKIHPGRPARREG
jgi:hypothetical protein